MPTHIHCKLARLQKPGFNNPVPNIHEGIFSAGILYSGDVTEVTIRKEFHNTQHDENQDFSPEMSRPSLRLARFEMSQTGL